MLLTKEQRTKDFTVSRAEPAGFHTTTDVFPDTKIYIYIAVAEKGKYIIQGYYF